ncbi:DNA translocase FtsK [Conexibacter sp. W3-3-2]|uniref:DNA translocase FtsK n=1 Tax=Conexibacter sp. W3-3-2 TaxID=2675227 RepID=UPI0012B7E7EB|nr:DNA translocase FtsK [Conexibacter sp. W3-3-2]MTD43179.1 DNA translocase FtsK [Conexibacter sp. W3-3-2]
MAATKNPKSRAAGARTSAGARSSAKSGAAARPRAKSGAAKPRARRAGGRAPRAPMLEQHHVDLIGLALVAAGVFLAFPLYLEWYGGAAGEAVVDGIERLVGQVSYLAPVAVAATGIVLVLRPVLPSGMRPFKAGAACLLLATTLMLAAGTLGLGPDGPNGDVWNAAIYSERGGILGSVLFWGASSAFSSIGAHIIALFLLLAGILLLTGASVAGVVQATASGVADTTRALRTTPAPAPARDRTSTGTGATRGGRAGSARTTAGRDRTVAPIVPPEPEDSEPAVRDDRTGQLDGALRYPDLWGDEDAPIRVEPTVVDERPPAPPVDLDADVEPELLAELDPEPEPAPPVPAPRAPRAAEPVVEEDEDVDELPVGEQAALALEDGQIEWHRPRAAMLKRSSAQSQRPDHAGQAQTAEALIVALQHLGIEAKVVGTVSGPHITRYELRLAPGVKMSKVANLKDDLAYALAATEIRILAPIPGKTAVGVEVPNKLRQVVTLGDVYEDAPDSFSPLTVWLGKDVSGKAIPADLAKMPHLLVAGTTGAGKSACVNGMLSSILLRATPDEVRLVLVDPKQVELNHYESVPHLLTPVITSPRKAANALQNLVKEMEWRYGIMAMAKTRSLPELNKHRRHNGEAQLPYILCVIDELADLMMVAPGDVEDSIIRIAQKARAVGIHLILATQSPRVDVITGMIKANVPSRIAFAVSSQTDSRVILDQNGAESLLGQGDMLFSPVGSSRLQRIQGAYIDEAQIEKITGWWARQGEPEIREDLLEEVEEEPKEDAGGADDGFDPDEDPLLGEAIQLVVEMGTASTSMLQRRLRLGYTRAGRLIDMLERRGVISGYEGSKPRQVLVTEGDLPRVLAALAERGDVAGAQETPSGPSPAGGGPDVAEIPDAGEMLGD